MLTVNALSQLIFPWKIDVKILPLYDAPQFAEPVTDRLWHAFGGNTLPREFFASIVAHSQKPEQLPVTFVGVEGDKLLGTVGLWRCDLISRQDLFPWMAALYIEPEARGQGLAGLLQQHVIRYASGRGYSRLHLYSACRDFYERFGWQYMGEGLDYPATPVHLYRYELAEPEGALTE